MIGRLGTGEYVVSGGFGGGQLLVYPESGGGVHRVIGRSGQGPGEFGNTSRLVVGPRDTLYVLDDAHGRLQVLTPDGSFVRSFPMPASTNRPFALLDDGDFIFHEYPHAAEDELFTLVDPTGNVKARFGTATGPEFDLDQWILNAASDGGFWAASIWEYEVHHWATPDSVARTVVRDASWFPHQPRPSGRELDGLYLTRLPPPLVRHVWQDPNTGHLWVYSQVPDPAWEPGLPVEMTPEWGRRTFDTVVEAIDLEIGRVVGRGRSDELLGPVCGSRLMFRVAATELGDTRAVILEPTIVDVP